MPLFKAIVTFQAPEEEEREVKRIFQADDKEDAKRRLEAECPPAFICMIGEIEEITDDPSLGQEN